MKTLALFGSTGSIGKQTLEVLRAFPGEFEVVGLTAHKNAELLAEQAGEFLNENGLSKPQIEAKSVRAHRFPRGAFLAPTPEQVADLIARADFVVNAVPGFDGLAISLAAVRASTPTSPKILLSANKESLAIAGKFLRAEAQRTGAEIRPLDSEASAIWQLLTEAAPTKNNPISSVTLTCSGGPFFGKTTADLALVTPAQALAHPTWKMGPKVSIDSATLINKVLEVYEVHNLFDIPLKDIHIRVHRQSLVHSMVHTKTGATRMHITQNDMRLFISYALHYPEQPKCPWPIQRAPKSQMDFTPPDSETFRPLKWLKLHAGNPNFPIILNALNDIAVARFLRGEMTFLGIYDFIEAGLDRWLWETPPSTLEELLEFHEKITHHSSEPPVRISSKESRGADAEG
ncbi:MAG: 1-deoxy-D-xylulose-5-phosphate reductoisomerase [Candidatus Gracilibacteria bacterium]|jgi:1-deoxy-D-xylulose-5-phosphate reductoisomerase